MGKVYDFATLDFIKETPITMRALEKELPEVAKLGILFPDDKCDTSGLPVRDLHRMQSGFSLFLYHADISRNDRGIGRHRILH